jgi:hypothetical protein
MAFVSVNTNAQPLGTFRPPMRDLDLEDLWIYGDNWVMVNLKPATTSIELVQTIEGASTLTLKVRDYYRALLRSNLTQTRSRIVLDNIEFTLVKIAHDGGEVTLTLEETAANLLRRYDSPRKAARDSITRAGFCRGLVAEVRERNIPWNCPEERERQPIAAS